MHVTYIYHSCYMVELEHHILLFDYMKGKLPTLDAHKKLFVFISHAHHDHFDKAVFHLSHPDITYIISDDVHTTHENIYFVSPHKTYHISDLKIQTLASTDQGVAFLIQTEGVQFYHAGDLHWWDWGKEDTPEESEAMECAYKQELESIKDISIDVAFLVLDPRLEERFAKGMLTFLKTCHVKVVFPMHMWGDDTVIHRLLACEESIDYRKRIQNVHKEGQTFLIEVS